MKGNSYTVSPGITAELTYGTDAVNPATFSVPSGYLPAGVSVNFSNSPPPTVLTTATPTCASAFTVSTSAGTPVGNFSFPIRTTIVLNAETTITKETTYAFTVTEPFNYSMAWSVASSATITQGGNFIADFQATKTAGATSESVSFSTRTAPQGVSVFITPSSCFPGSNCPNPIAMEIRTTFTGGASDTPTGTHIITLTGVSASGITRSLTFTLTVNPGFNFTLTANNTSGGTYAGGTADFLPTLTPTYVSGSTG